MNTSKQIKVNNHTYVVIECTLCRAAINAIERPCGMCNPFTIIYVDKAGGLSSVFRVILMYMDRCHDFEPQVITG